MIKMIVIAKRVASGNLTFFRNNPERNFVSIQELVSFAAEYEKGRFEPLAWMVGSDRYDAGINALLKECIDAGRTIKLIGNRYLALSTGPYPVIENNDQGQMTVTVPKNFDIDAIYSEKSKAVFKKAYEEVHPADAAMIKRDGPSKIKVEKELKVCVELAGPSSHPGLLAVSSFGRFN